MMKRNLLINSIAVLLFLFSCNLFAQTPEKINYQAVARDNAGNVLGQEQISVRFSISEISTNSVIYEETHQDVMTNDFGLFMLHIGDGNVISGEFASIPWGHDGYNLTVEIDQGSGYEEVATNQLVSVPYSLHARKSDTAAYARSSSTSMRMLTDVDINTLNSGEILRWDGSMWVPSRDNVADDDPDPVNEIQSLSISGDELSISRGNTVTLPTGGGADDWGSQVAQTDATITGDGTSGNPLGLAPQSAANGQVLKWNQSAWIPMSDNFTDEDADTTNELQVLNFNNDTLSISGGNYIDIQDDWGSQVAATGAGITGDGTVSNPLGIAQLGADSAQVLEWNGTAWMPATDNVADGDTNSTNELQNLSIEGNNLTISNGNTVFLPGGDNWGNQAVVANAPLVGNGTTTNPLEIGQQGATAGQALKWNGSAWVPSTDNTGPTYSAGTGINISGSNVITNTGDTNPGNDITTSTSAGGDLSGTYPNPTVVGLQGNSVSNSSPSNDDILTWNSSANQWEPQASSGGGGTDNDWVIGNNIIYNTTDKVGINTNNPEQLFHVTQDTDSTGYSIFGQKTQASTGNDYFSIGVMGNTGTPSGWGVGYGVMGNGDQNGFIIHGVHAELNPNLPTGQVMNAQGLSALYATGENNGHSGLFIDGNVGIGTIGPSYLLEVNGDAAKPGGGQWTAASDARLKKDVKPFESGLAILEKVEPVRYKYNGKLEFSTEEEHIGVIAQELKKVAPFMVGTFTKKPEPTIKNGKKEFNRESAETYYSVDPSAFTYITINAVKEQQEIINSQGKTIDAQQDEIENLKEELDQIKDILRKNGIEVE